MQSILIYLLAGVVFVLSGCSAHQPEIQQGNVLTPEMITQLHPGLTKKQVRFIVGTPAVIDAFHPDQWNYVYWLIGEDGKITRRQLIVTFEHDVLTRMAGEGVTLPAAPVEQP